jgi:hypothetical protein
LFTNTRGFPPLFLNLRTLRLSAHKCEARHRSQLVRLFSFFSFFHSLTDSSLLPASPSMCRPLCAPLDTSPLACPLNTSPLVCPLNALPLAHPSFSPLRHLVPVVLPLPHLMSPLLTCCVAMSFGVPVAPLRHSSPVCRGTE